MLCRQSIFSAWSCPFFFVFFNWHNTFVQTSFKNINKLGPLRLTWQKTHYQMSWRRTNIFLEKDFTNEMSLQNIKEKKSWLSHKILPKTSKFVWYQPFSTLNNNNFFFFFFLLSSSCVIYFSPKNTLWRKEKKWTAMVGRRKKKKQAQRVKKREAALQRKTQTCCTQPQNQRTQIQVQQKANSTTQG